MGYQLVARCYTSWTGLPDRPFRLLCYMALLCRDDDPIPTFWAGREALADALGLDSSESAHRVTRRAIASLVSAGALERLRSGGRGRRAEYRLLIERKGDTSVLLRGTPESALGGHRSPPQGDTRVRLRGTQESPPLTTEQNRGVQEEEHQLPDVSVTGPSLRVVTCGGVFDRSARSYLDNIVVFATSTA